MSLANQVSQQLQFAPKIGYKILIDMANEGQIFIDGTTHPAVVTEQDEGGADTTLKTSKSTFEGIINGTTDPNMAALTGKMKVEGSVGVALKLASLLED